MLPYIRNHVSRYVCIHRDVITEFFPDHSRADIRKKKFSDIVGFIDSVDNKAWYHMKRNQFSYLIDILPLSSFIDYIRAYDQHEIIIGIEIKEFSHGIDRIADAAAFPLDIEYMNRRFEGFHGTDAHLETMLEGCCGFSKRMFIAWNHEYRIDIGRLEDI